MLRPEAGGDHPPSLDGGSLAFFSGVSTLVPASVQQYLHVGIYYGGYMSITMKVDMGNDPR